MHTGICLIPTCIWGLLLITICIRGLLVMRSLYAYGDLRNPRMHTGFPVCIRHIIPVCIRLSPYAYGDPRMHIGITVWIWLEIKYNMNTEISLCNHFTTFKFNHCDSCSTCCSCGARAANPTCLLACTAVSAAVTLTVALDHSLTSNR
jgi:hypothetical protein